MYSFYFNVMDLAIIGLLITITVFSKSKFTLKDPNCLESLIIWLSLSEAILTTLRMITSVVPLKLYKNIFINYFCTIIYMPLLIFWIFRCTLWLRNSLDEENKPFTCLASYEFLIVLYFLATNYTLFVCSTIVIISKSMKMFQDRRIRNIHNEIENVYDNSYYSNINHIDSLIRRANLQSDEIFLTDNEFNRLPKKNLNTIDMENSKIQSCSICFEDFSKEEKVIIFKECLHVFHIDCIRDWTKRKPICPNCKRNVRKEILTHVQNERRRNY